MESRIDSIAASRGVELTVWKKIKTEAKKVAALSKKTGIECFASQPGDARLALHRKNGKKIDFWSLRRKKIEYSLANYKSIEHLVFSSDGRILAALERGKKIHLFDVEKRELRKSVHIPSGAEAPLVSAATSNLFVYATTFPNARNSWVHSLDIDGKRNDLIKLKGCITHISVSEDGTMVAFAFRDRGGNFIVGYYKLGNKNFTKISKVTASINHIAISIPKRGGAKRMQLVFATEDKLYWWSEKKKNIEVTDLSKLRISPLSVVFTNAGLGIIGIDANKGSNKIACYATDSRNKSLKKQYTLKWSGDLARVKATFCQ